MAVHADAEQLLGAAASAADRQRRERSGGKSEPAVHQSAVRIEACGIDLVIHADAEHFGIAGAELTRGQRLERARRHEEPAAHHHAVAVETRGEHLVVHADGEHHGRSAGVAADTRDREAAEDAGPDEEPAVGQGAVRIEPRRVDVVVHAEPENIRRVLRTVRSRSNGRELARRDHHPRPGQLAVAVVNGVENLMVGGQGKGDGRHRAVFELFDR